MKTALDFALEDVALPLRESEGNNRSPRIDEINRAVGLPLGSPYCAAGVSWCFRVAGATHFPFSGGSQAIKAAFESKGLLTDEPNELLHWQGALFGWSDGDGHGHIGFVAKRLVQAGRVVAIGTAEYNTDKAGSRDGQGAYCLSRATINPAHRLWYLNVSDYPGGAWWEE